MKLKQLGLLGLCGLLLCGCTNLKANTDSENETANDTDIILSAGTVDDTVIDPEDEIIVPKIIETSTPEVTETPEIEVKDDVQEEVKTTKTEDKKDTVQTSEQPKQEDVEKDVPKQNPEPTPTTPTPVPTDPPKDEPKEEPKIEEEIKYGGWHENDKAKSVFNKINKIRNENGLSELPWSDGDTWLADIRVEELVSEVANGTVHSGLKKYDRYVGEIAGYGYGASGVVDAWMNSTGHANQILADYNTSMAVGVYYDEYTASSYYIVIFR
ncbi:MAG: hypothetical protein J6K75_03925 [Erysipelotrichaceae bacterium]|nr:hypothetical protein [Erysipelotrichaceae bacterium]